MDRRGAGLSVAVFFGLLLVGTTESADAAELEVATSGQLVTDCREFAKAQAGRSYSAVAAASCAAYLTGFAQGFLNRQNTPEAVIGKSCIKDIDARSLARELLASMASDYDPRSDFLPPNLTMMGLLTMNHLCP
jgi:hypothetical protein